MKESNAMAKTVTPRTLAVTPRMEEAWQAVDACFGRFCLTAGIELHAMMVADVEDLCGDRHARSPERRVTGHRSRRPRAGSWRDPSSAWRNGSPATSPSSICSSFRSNVAEDIVLIGAIGIDGKGDKHSLGLVEGATENAAAV